MTDIAIKIEHLNYVYSPGTAYEKHALKDICLEIPHGEFVGIIGHTGSGKSTLIQHLNGLVKATDGAIYYNGENIYQNGYDMRRLRNQVGLVFQYPEYQLFEIDVLTDVCFGPKNQGLSKEECEKRALEALKLVGNIISHLLLNFREDRSEESQSQECLRCVQRFWCWMSRLQDWTQKEEMIFWIRLHTCINRVI